ncbi:hypothetical protein B296_00037336 [Ensete ventricosum]|uniref:Uncharacterized protein n=1 Tax=Ensete ventricosum TaxID=4639 RepID=A0A426Y8C9_ENSVE|nr:hypothetical protein B296_00037336 [Ensete ventricosum]
MLGKWEEAAKDLHVASKLDYDEEISSVLKKVEPNAHKIEEHRRKYDRLRKEREDKKVERERQRRRAEAQAAYEKAKNQEQSSCKASGCTSDECAGGMPGGFPGGMPGGFPGAMPGGSPGAMPGGFPGAMPGGFPGAMPGSVPGNIDMSKILNQDPELMAAFSDPEIMAALQDDDSLDCKFAGFVIPLSYHINIVIDHRRPRRSMDAFFHGLDCRLRVSGMVADSIMMGIVNSSMEDAYKKSCTNDGDLDRLIEKSRFCELAIMQLEWCLKYLQEEMDNATVDSACDREKLFCDLLETRDRIDNRLDETKLAIAEKDVELARRKESEIKLRLALELKGEEVRSLHHTLGADRRAKNDACDGFASRDGVNEEESDGHVFDELECSMGKQLRKIRGKLEHGRQTLTNVMLNMRSSPRVGVANPNPGFDMDSGGLKALHELNDMAQLTLDFNDMVIDLDMLKEEVRSSFSTIVSSISVFKATTAEQQWAWNMEREISTVIISSFVRDVRREWAANPDTNLLSFIHELEALASQITVPFNDVMDPKAQCNPLSIVVPDMETKDEVEKDASVAGNSSPPKGGHLYGVSQRGADDHVGGIERNNELIDSAFRAGELLNMNDLSEKDPPGNFVVDLTNYHDSTRTQKLDSDGETIAKVTSRLEGIIKRAKSEFADIHIPMHTPPDSETKHEATKKIIQKPIDSHLKDLGLHEEIRRLKEEKDEMETKAVIMEDVYRINYKGLMERLLTDFFHVELEVLTREDTFRIVFGELIKELMSMREAHTSEQLLREEIRYIILSEVIKGLLCANNAAKDTEFSGKPEQGKDSLLINPTTEKGSDYVLNSGIRKNSVDDLNGLDIEESDAFRSASNLETSPQGAITGTMQQGQPTLSYASITDENNIVHGSGASTGIRKQNKSEFSCMSAGIVEEHWDDFHFMTMLVEQIIQMVNDFGLLTCEKISINISRYFILLDLMKSTFSYSQSIMRI